MGKSTARPHRRANANEMQVTENPIARVHFDYFYLNSEDEGKGENPMIIMAAEGIDAVTTLPAGKKGAEGNEWLVKLLNGDLENWGLANCQLIFKCDTEHPIVALVRRLAAYRVNGQEGKTVMEHSPRGESRSNGFVENSVRRTKNQIRTFKAQLEAELKTNIKAEAAILQWLVRWAGVSLSRYVVGKDGRTPYERIRTRRCHAPLARFGEMVFFKRSGKPKLQAANVESKVESGVWVGIATRTGDSIIMTNEGTVRAWTVKRRADEYKWDAAYIERCHESIVQPNPNRPGTHVPIKITIPSAEPTGITMPKGTPRAAHRIHITQKDIMKYMATTGCPGCRSSLSNTTPRNHSELCRKRIEESIDKDPTQQDRINKMVYEEGLKQQDEKKEHAEVANEPGSASNDSNNAVEPRVGGGENTQHNDNAQIDKPLDLKPDASQTAKRSADDSDATDAMNAKRARATPTQSAPQQSRDNATINSQRVIKDSGLSI